MSFKQSDDRYILEEMFLWKEADSDSFHYWIRGKFINWFNHAMNLFPFNDLSQLLSTIIIIDVGFGEMLDARINL